MKCLKNLVMVLAVFALAMPLASFSRAEKVHVLTWAVGGLIVAMLVADYAGRFIESRARRQGAAQ